MRFLAQAVPTEDLTPSLQLLGLVLSVAAGVMLTLLVKARLAKGKVATDAATSARADRQQEYDATDGLIERLTARLDKQDARIDELEQKLSNALEQVGVASGARIAAESRADEAERRAKRAESTVDRLQIRIEHLEDEVRILRKQLIDRGETPTLPVYKDRLPENPNELP